MPTVSLQQELGMNSDDDLGVVDIKGAKTGPRATHSNESVVELVRCSGMELPKERQSSLGIYAPYISDPNLFCRKEWPEVPGLVTRPFTDGFEAFDNIKLLLEVVDSVSDGLPNGLEFDRNVVNDLQLGGLIVRPGRDTEPGC